MKWWYPWGEDLDSKADWTPRRRFDDDDLATFSIAIWSAFEDDRMQIKILAFGDEGFCSKRNLADFIDESLGRRFEKEDNIIALQDLSARIYEIIEGIRNAR